MKNEPPALIQKLVVGLGNPGCEYSGTRHNLGFLALDAFLSSLGVQKNFIPAGKSRVQAVTVDDIEVLLVRPSTYMNLSGTAVAALLTKTGLEITDILVVHDEMDLPPGRSKMSIGGSSAGHRGVADIIEKCGENFTRIKIGIGSPPEQSVIDGAEWVLGKADSEDQALFDEIMPIVAGGIRRWILTGPKKAMTWFNPITKENKETETDTDEPQEGDPIE